MQCCQLEAGEFRRRPDISEARVLLESVHLAFGLTFQGQHDLHQASGCGGRILMLHTAHWNKELAIRAPRARGCVAAEALSALQDQVLSEFRPRRMRSSVSLVMHLLTLGEVISVII